MLSTWIENTTLKLYLAGLGSWVTPIDEFHHQTHHRNDDPNDCLKAIGIIVESVPEGLLVLKSVQDALFDWPSRRDPRLLIQQLDDAIRSA